MPIAGLTRWPIWRRWFGTRSERAVEKHLQRLGYRTLGRNVELPVGELDLIMRHGDIIVFVEVRSTEGTDTTRPADSVDYLKQKKLTQLASLWLQRNKLLDYTSRFDIVAVSWPAHQKAPDIQHFIDAFPPTGRNQMFG